MKNKLKMWTIVSAAASLLSMLGHAGVASAAGDPITGGQVLEGAWGIYVGPVTPTAMNPGLYLPVLFTRDGGMVSVNVQQDNPQTVERYGGAVGEWKRTGVGQFSLDFAFPVVHLPTGRFSGIFYDHATIQLSATGDELNGTLKSELLDKNGNLIFASPGTATVLGKRIAGPTGGLPLLFQ